MGQFRTLGTMPVEVTAYELPPIGTQCYLVSNPELKAFAVFDAPMEAWPVAQDHAARTGYRLDGLYFTHGHWDHTLDGKHFNEAGIPCFAHPQEKPFFETPGIMSAFSIPGLEIPEIDIGTWLEHGQQLEIVGARVEIRHVPGHSQGSILYWFIDDKFAITGDAIFSGSIGRTDFPGCSFAQLQQSIREQVYTLPDDTVLYPGHGPETSVGGEAASNPFVKRRTV